MKRKITALVSDANDNLIRTSVDGRSFIVVDCDACITENVLFPSERKAFFAEESLLEKVQPGMYIVI